MKKEQLEQIIQKEVKEVLNESFFHLRKEQKVGLALREMRKRLKEIEMSYDRALQKANEGPVNEAEVSNWVRTYESLKGLDERIHKLLSSMKG